MQQGHWERDTDREKTEYTTHTHGMNKSKRNG